MHYRISCEAPRSCVIVQRNVPFLLNIHVHVPYGTDMVASFAVVA